MVGRLQGKIAIITGTGGAMGRAAALRFAAEGAKVVGTDVNAASGEETLQLVKKAGGEMVSLHPLDISYAEGAAKLMQFTLDAYGGVDVLYNNAAMAYFAWVPEMSFKQFADTMREEVDIIFHLTQMAWPHLIKSGKGSIINIASGAGNMALPEQGALAHCAGKGAVISMTRQYAAEGGPHNIRANTIAPGFVVSPQSRPLMEDPTWVEKLVAKRMIKRPGEPEEIVATAVFLASDEASYITGANIAVDGGSTAM